MAKASQLTLENRHLRVEIDRRDLAAHVTVKATGETLRMAAGQPDDAMTWRAGTGKWVGFRDFPVTVRKGGDQSATGRIEALGLAVKISLDDSDVVFEVTPSGRARGGGVLREVLYPRHFMLPRREGAYATFPLGQGSLIPATETALFHHREGYAEGVAHWLGGYTGRTGYCGIAETPDDLFQAVDHRSDSAASTFFHWLGSLGRLRYARRARYVFGKGLDYVAQAKTYRAHCRKAGIFRSLQDKARENPNIAGLRGAPILCALASIRREKTFHYECHKFTDLAERIERFRRDTDIEKAVVHIDGWGWWGYDSMHPDTVPPNRDCGGPAGLSELARRVKALGYLFGLHDQYIDFYFHAPSYDERLCTVTEDGRPARVNMWAGGPCGHLCYSQVPRFLKRNLYDGVRRYYPMYHNSPSIWDMVQPTAYYLDCFCRTVECWSKDHPLTRTQSRRLQNEVFRMTRDGRDGEGIVLSVEHPRDFAVPYIEFGWSLGHLSADVMTTGGAAEYRAVGIPVPLWHLVFHDAVCVPSPGDDLLEALLYAQAPYFWARGQEIPPDEIRRKKVLLALHEDAGFAEMTGHEVLSPDGSVQKCTYDGGLTVEVDKKAGTYRISGGRAETPGASQL